MLAIAGCFRAMDYGVLGSIQVMLTPFRNSFQSLLASWLELTTTGKFVGQIAFREKLPCPADLADECLQVLVMVVMKIEALS